MIKRALTEMCPYSILKFNPHIESKLKKWKKQCEIVYDMLNKSGFGWNDTLKCVEVDSMRPKDLMLRLLFIDLI